VPDQTDQYRKIILKRAADLFAIAKGDQDVIDIVMPAIDNRISSFNTTISKLNAYTINPTDSWLINVNNAFINIYKDDNQGYYVHKNFLVNLRQFYEDQMNRFNKLASDISQAKYISTDDFNAINKAQDADLKTLNPDILTKDIADFKTEVDTDDEYLKDSTDKLAAKINSLSRNSSNSGSQINQYIYIPPQITIPVINPVRTTNCNFNQSYGSAGVPSGGTMTCNSY